MSSEFIQRQKHDSLRDISALGSLVFYILLLAISLIFKKYDLFYKMVLGLILIYAATIIFRTIFFKERPKRFSYNNYIEKLDAASFPSLHAARTAFLGLLLSKYFENYVLTAIMIVIILIVSYARVYLKKHDLMDVSAGIILGVLAYAATMYLL